MATTLDALRRIVRIRLNEVYALTTPPSPVVGVQGTPGTRVITYKIVANNGVGHSEASQGKVITNGPSTSDGNNFPQLNWVSVPGATTYSVYRTTTNGLPATTGLIAISGSTTLDDTGLAGDGSTAPITNTSGLDAPFWTDQELLDILILGCRDLWREIVDLHQGHFTTIDAENVSLAANSATLTGVPDDCFRVLMIEPRDLTNASTNRYTYFKPKQYHSMAFQSARAINTASFRDNCMIYYDILNAGSPVDAPSIVVAPMVSSAILLRLVYVHVLPELVESSDSPIPGEADNALISWTVAWARAKEREDRMPDPAWLATYSTDKQHLLIALTPRQEQEEEVTEGFLGEDW